MHENGDGNFRGGSVGCGTGRLNWRAAGRGDLVIDLVAGAVPTRFHSLLAVRFHVATLDVPDDGETAAAGLALALGEVAAATGHARCSLVVRGPALPLALRVLRDRPGLVDTLVLMAPLPADAADAAALDALSVAAPPMLVLSGTRGSASPPEAGSRFRARLRTCHYVLVYDAGDTIETDRPEATAAVTGDFLARRDKFIVAHTSGLIHP